MKSPTMNKVITFSPRIWENLIYYSCSDVICFETGDGGHQQSKYNIDALMAKFESMEKELQG